jgi:hypothetical protein
MKTMFQGSRFNRLALRSLVLAVGFACALPAGAGAVKSRGPLSPLLAELAKPAVAAKAPAVQDELLGVATEEPGGLIRDGQRVQVTARFAAGALGALPQLREAGADVVEASGEQQTATLAVAPEDLPAIASVPGVAAVWQVRRPIAYGVGAGCEGGSVLSEGLAQLRVDDARGAFNLRGRGITIGVLSDSYDTAGEAANGGPIATHAAGDIASNDLPGPAGSCADQQLPVGVLAEGDAEGADEGRAMLQIIHDLAPHAQLAFATAFKSEGSFAQNIERLARPVSVGGAGADVIVDDVAWFEEPFFQDGPGAAAINKVTAEGVTYLTATGNNNLIASGRDIASWEASGFRDSGSCPAAVFLLSGFNGKHCLDFDPSGEADDTFGITVKAGETLTVDLQWAEPWYGVNTDLDAFLLSGAGTVLAESAEGNSGAEGTQRPVEIVQWTNSAGSERTVQLAINRFAGADPRLKLILMQNGGGVSATEYQESSSGDVVGPSISGHAGAPSAISVAAVPFNSSGMPERYSSRGPVVHLFAPVQGTTPAAEFASAETIAKPDIAATDCGATTFFASLSVGTWRFCGTSAAAPHAAAVAALLRQAKPSQPAASYREAMTETAVPVGAFGPTAVGAGLVDAFAALGSLPGPLEGEDGPSTSVTPIVASSAPSPADPGGSSGSGTATSGGPAVPPGTSLPKHPGRLVRTRSKTARVVFRFGSDQAGSTFLCKVDAGRLRPCGSRIVRRFGLGPHAITARAVSSAGLADPTPAVFRFRVHHVV